VATGLSQRTHVCHVGYARLPCSKGFGIGRFASDSIWAALRSTRSSQTHSAADWCTVTADECASACPNCGCSPARSRDWSVPGPRDIPYGTRVLRLIWHKRRWRCAALRLGVLGLLIIVDWVLVAYGEWITLGDGSQEGVIFFCPHLTITLPVHQTSEGHNSGDNNGGTCHIV